MENIKEYCYNVFENDYNKLINISAKNMYFNPRSTNKHIEQIVLFFNQILLDVKTDDDIIKLFKISDVNTKLNKSDLKINIISIAPYYLCCNLLNNNCDNCSICYGAKNEMFKNVLKYRMYNYIFFLILEYLRNVDFNRYIKILYTAVDINKNKLTEIIRINQQSDIKNNTQLIILNEMLLYIKMQYNINTVFYTYSKTRNLDFSRINKHFIINKSVPIIYNKDDLLKYENESNIFITIDKNIKFNEISIKNKYLCKNNCGQCQNCIKKNNTVTLCYKH